MMRLTNHHGTFQIFAETYTLKTVADRPFVYLESCDGKRLADLFVFSSVHPLHGRDETIATGDWSVEETDQEISLSVTTESSVWQQKTYRFRCSSRRLVYEVEVEGVGQLCEANYFGGYSSANPRWGSGFYWSGNHFLQGFSPEPGQEEVNSFEPGQGAVIDLMGVPLPGKAHWFFTPPPFCFGFKTSAGWFGLGVEARPGENRFTEYRYHGEQGGFHLSLSFEGHTPVAGTYLLPAIGFDFGAGPYELLSAHVQALQVGAAIPVVERRANPAWWYEPIFCGWGEQCYLAGLVKGQAPDFSRQALYDDFLRTLDRNELRPGIVVLDDKWQATYGENRPDELKWPDLPGFVRRQHAQGSKVLLWLKAWDPEGVPVEECITNARGLPVAVDPTNPAFERRLCESVRRLLDSQGCDADGFKIDFTARIPSGPGICSYGDAWGLELMKRYLGLLYEAAKRVKPDALVMAHTPHPYLADVIDMIRLNDVVVEKDVNRLMAARARVAAIACPAAIIDTDNWPMADKAAWRRYLRLQPELGVPSLYFASHIDSTREPLQAQDYRLVREAWARHRARLALAGSAPPAARPPFSLGDWLKAPRFPALRKKSAMLPVRK